MPKFRCEHCRQKISAPDTHVGRRVRCPRCKEAVRVPAAIDPSVNPAAVDPVIVAPPALAPADASAAADPQASAKARPQPIRVTPVAIEPPEESAPHAALKRPGGVLTARAEQDFSSVFGDWTSRENPAEPPPAPNAGSIDAPPPVSEIPPVATPAPVEDRSADSMEASSAASVASPSPAQDDSTTRPPATDQAVEDASPAGDTTLHEPSGDSFDIAPEAWAPAPEPSLNDIPLSDTAPTDAPPRHAPSGDAPPGHAPSGEASPSEAPPSDAPSSDAPPSDFSPLDAVAGEAGDFTGYEHFPTGPDVPDPLEPPIPVWDAPLPPSFESESEPQPESDPRLGPRHMEAIEPSEVIDAPRKRRRPEMDSAAELEDLLRHLEPSAQGRVVDRPARRTRVRPQPSGKPAAIRVLGAVSLAVGLAAVALSLLPSAMRYAAPVGSGGVVLALVGLILAVGRRSGAVGLPIGGATVSAVGITCAVLGAYGLLPLGAHRAVIAGGATRAVDVPVAPTVVAAPVVDPYVPATSPLLVDQIQVRVASVLLLEPAVYTGDYSSLHTLPQLRLQITFDLRATGDRRITYQPWRRSGDDGPQVKLTDPAGQDLTLESLPPRSNVPATAPIGALAGATLVAPHGGAVSDVLLFDPPEGPPQDLKLDLPGANIGAPGAILHIRIPAAMIRAQ